jgi:tRNA-splicing ligase RtcB
MNKKQLMKLGVPEDCVPAAITGIQNAVMAGVCKGKQADKVILKILENPAAYAQDPHFGPLVEGLAEDAKEPARRDPVPYKTWGAEFIDEASHQQMRQACSLPNAVGGALMPDAHLGYGLPIGGVLALEGAVCPYAVGVDIACRMKLSVLDLPLDLLDSERKSAPLDRALEQGTKFGSGKSFERKQQHDVMDADWNVSRITRENKDRAWAQLGTSGSGNHFVEFGVLTLDKPELGLEAGSYLALLSHSGSRGTGHAVCSTYSSIAQSKLPKKYSDLGNLAWLDLNSQEGQDYWNAMNLMGDYAAANHDVIHRNVAKLAGAKIISGVENHHNFAWKETHGGREVIVHRKGATPAGEGVLGVIPGSMGTPAYVVRGKGSAESFASASHGAGRVMSRTKAKEKFNFRAVQKDLEKKGVRVLSAGADEVPGVYKDIESVIREQTDLVVPIARFDPRIVKMCGDGSKAED